MKKNRFVLAGILLLILLGLGQAAEIIYVPWLAMYADKSTLFIRWGSCGDNAAIKMWFGPGLASVNIGIVFAEKRTDSEKLNSAAIKLLNLLKSENPDLNDLAKKIGLTFLRYEKADNIN
jgi:hypothetical protein